MKCVYAQELFSDYIAQTMESALTVSLENHLADCAACREELAGLRHVWAALDQAPRVEPPAFFHERLMSHVEVAQAAAEAAARKRALWDWRLLFRPRALAFGAAAAVLLLACADAVQTRPATLNPLGYLIRLVRPIPATSPSLEAQVTRAEWISNPEGGGTLTVHLKASTMPTRAGSLTYRAQAVEYPQAVAQGMLAPEGETKVTLTLPQTPTGKALRLLLMLSTAEGEKSFQTVAIPILAVPGISPEDAAP